MNDISSCDVSVYQDCLDYIDSYWSRIIRYEPEDKQTLIGLPYRYVVPNHEMFVELYYWDSYFIALGLERTSLSELVIDITNNLLYLFERFGRIPNTSRYYHLSRSQPPFLTQMILMSHALQGGTDLQWLERAFRLAEQEYFHVWRGTTFPDEREVLPSLSRYYDIDIWHAAAEAESGWDMTPRYANRCLDFIAVDLNALLFRYERDFAQIEQILGRDYNVKRWRSQAERRRRAVNKYLWNEEDGCFYDYDIKHGRQSHFLSIATFFPLWAGLATKKQAERIVKVTLPRLEQAHGIPTTQEWYPEPDEVGKQWAWPNGWAPLQWIAVSGLDRYGFKKDARRVAKKWVDLVNKVFIAEGLNFEKYDVVNGGRAVPARYPDQPGFGWTNAIFLRFVQYLSTGRL